MEGNAANAAMMAVTDQPLVFSRASWKLQKHLRLQFKLRAFLLKPSGLFTQSQWYLHDLPSALPVRRALCCRRAASPPPHCAGRRWEGYER